MAWCALQSLTQIFWGLHTYTFREGHGLHWQLLVLSVLVGLQVRQGRVGLEFRVCVMAHLCQPAGAVHLCQLAGAVGQGWAELSSRDCVCVVEAGEGSAGAVGQVRVG